MTPKENCPAVKIKEKKKGGGGVVVVVVLTLLCTMLHMMACKRTKRFHEG